MNSTQNKKLEQVKETTLVIGIDVGSETHYARAYIIFLRCLCPIQNKFHMHIKK